MSPTLILTHGAGAGTKHPFFGRFGHALRERAIRVRTYDLPYMRAGKKRVDPPAICHTAIRDEVARAAGEDDAPLFAGGKSFGGRMTSQAAAEGPLDRVRGLVFLGFPLHPPGKPGTSRAEHLARVGVPMLFLQGTRDEFAALDLLRPVVASLGDRATLHLVDGADHSFHVLKSSGRGDGDVIDELAEVAAGWMKKRA